MSAKQITVTIPGIVQYTGTIPNKATQTKDEFANAVHPYMNYMNTNFVPGSVDFGTALSTFKIEANEVAEEVNTNAIAVNTNKELTYEYRNDAITSKDLALQAKETIENYILPTEATYNINDIETKIRRAKALVLTRAIL